MLINFRVKNYRSFYDEALFSMQAIPEQELSQHNTFFVDEKLIKKGENEILKSAVVFGSNASGKTNLIKALKFMKTLVLSSGNYAFPTIFLNEPFLFYNEASNEPTAFEIEIISNSTFFNYGFEIQNRQIIKEFLYKRSEKKFTLFTRNSSGIDVCGIKKNDFIDKTFDGFNTQFLFLPFLANLKYKYSEDINSVIKWFQNLTVFFEDEFKNYVNNFDIYSQDDGRYKERALDILKQADIGIIDFNVIKIKEENKENIDLETVFNLYDKEGSLLENKDKRIGLLKNAGFHSNGTFRLMSFLGLILKCIDAGGVIVLDEVDAQIHFLVVDYILGLFNSIANNPNNAQFVCTVHNVMLMDDDLRRDQIYFTKKDEVGKSVLYSLSDFEGVEYRDLFSKKYLAGFYSAIPSLKKGV